MKKLQTWLGIALTGVLFSSVITASAQPAQAGYATVVRVQGLAWYSLDGGVHTNPLVAGKFLEAGSTIYTGPGGVVDVVLAKTIEQPQAAWVPGRISLAVDSPVHGMISYKASAEQNVVRLMENTTLAIDKLTTTSSFVDTVSDTELNLKKGSIYASVKKLSPAAQYVVKTPTGIAGVRGTQFALTLNDDGTIKALPVYKTTDANGGVVLVPDPATPAILITGGLEYVQGNPTPITIAPDVISTLQSLFSSVRTIYVEVVNYDLNHYTIIKDYDQTAVLVSPQFGF